MKEHEYKFGDQVRFVAGFYEKLSGTLVNVLTLKKGLFEYDIELENGQRVYLIPSNHFELKPVLTITENSFEKTN